MGRLKEELGESRRELKRLVEEVEKQKGAAKENLEKLQRLFN